MARLMMAAVLFMATGLQAGELKLELHGKGMANNQVRVAVYSASQSGQFPSGGNFYLATVSEAIGDSLIVTVPGLPPGKYAVAAFVDNNKNGKLDKNVLGLPVEIYGFSNDVRGKFGPPVFTEAAFEVGENAIFQSIQLH